MQLKNLSFQPKWQSHPPARAARDINGRHLKRFLRLKPANVAFTRFLLLLICWSDRVVYGWPASGHYHLAVTWPGLCNEECHRSLWYGQTWFARGIVYIQTQTLMYVGTRVLLESARCLCVENKFVIKISF